MTHSKGETLYEFFHKEVTTTVQKLGKDVPHEAQIYVANLLTRFSDPSEIFVKMEGKSELEPMAFMLQRALEDPIESRKIQTLQKMGDLAMFQSGFLPERIESRGLRLDYYINMGGMAYESASTLSRGGRSPFRHLLQRLAQCFRDLVHVLWELSDNSRMASDVGLISLYERWQKTGSERLERKLVKSGLILTPEPIAC